MTADKLRIDHERDLDRAIRTVLVDGRVRRRGPRSVIIQHAGVAWTFVCTANTWSLCGIGRQLLYRRGVRRMRHEMNAWESQRLDEIVHLTDI